MKFSNWNIIFFGQKEPTKVQFFRLLSALMKSSRISSCHFWNYKVRVYSNFTSLFGVINDNSSLFFYRKTLYILWTKRAHRNEIFQLLCSWVKFHQIPHVILETSNQFFSKKTSVSWEITLLYFFSWNFKWFGQKEPIKMQNLRLSTAHVKFHQVSTLICSFSWKYIKF